MRITPLTKVNDIAFGSSQDAIAAALGKPDKISTNSLGLVELSYPSAIYRFGGAGLEEATLNAKVIELGAVAVPFKLLGSYMRESDPSCFESSGFIVSPAYGIAYDPEYPCWVTAFAQSGIALWQAIGSKSS